MVALLVALGVMAVMMTMAMPVWRQTAQREKEEELLFRGSQYVRAIGLFEKKYANAPPPTVDVLVQEKFLRKKYKDPITNADFVPIPGAPTPAANGTQGQGRANAEATQAAIAALQAGSTAGRGGVIGVTSASKARSLRVFNGATHYNEWRFVYAAPAAAPGAGAGGGGGGQRGGRGQPGQGGNQGGPGGGAGPGRGQQGRGNGNDGRPGGPGNPGGRGNGPGGTPPLGQGPVGPFGGRGR